MEDEKMIQEAEAIKEKELKKSPKQTVEEWTEAHPKATKAIGICIKVGKYALAVAGGVLLKCGYDAVKKAAGSRADCSEDNDSDDSIDVESED